MWVATAMAVSRDQTSGFRLLPLASLTTRPVAGVLAHVVVLTFASWKAGGLVTCGAQVSPNFHLLPGVLGACLGASLVTHTGLQTLGRGLWGQCPGSGHWEPTW